MIRLVLFFSSIPSLLAVSYLFPRRTTTTEAPSTMAPSVAFALYCNASLHFHCNHSSTPCIPLEWVCDNVRECPDGQDELNCDYPHKCHPHEFMCHNGDCLTALYKCDGEADCSDGSDEDKCDVMAEIMQTKTTPRPTQASTRFSTTTASRRDFRPARCGPGEYQCASGLCIDAEAKCDGVWDCPSGDDESRCTDSLSTEAQTAGDDVTECQPGYFMCEGPFGLGCVPNALKCDGEKNCDDGSDEAHCEMTDVKEVSALLEELMREDAPSTLPEQLTTTTASSFSSDLLTSHYYDEELARKLAEWLRLKEQMLGSASVSSSRTTSTSAPTGDSRLGQYEDDAFEVIDRRLAALDSVVDPCQGANCTQYCIGKADGFECSCVEGYDLIDGYTCALSYHAKRVRERQLSERQKLLTVRIVPNVEETEERKITDADLFSVFTLYTNVPSALIKPELLSECSSKLTELLNNKPLKYIVVHIIGDQTLSFGGEALAPAGMGTIKTIEHTDPSDHRPLSELRYLIQQALDIKQERLHIELIDTYGW